MQHPFDKTLTVLNILINRSQQAISAIEDARWSELEKLLQNQKAAFYNFRYWDYTCQQYDADYGRKEDFASKLSTAQELNRKLESLVAFQCQELSQQLVKAGLNRKTLSKFRSSKNAQSGFRLGV